MLRLYSFIMQLFSGLPDYSLAVADLGLTPYRQAMDLQERLRDLREQGRAPDTLLLLEHPLVLTTGRRNCLQDLRVSPAWLSDQGVEIIPADRGGRMTLHAPGQLVGYGVVRVESPADYVRGLEQVIISILALYGVEARSRSVEGSQFTGVWVGDSKIASIGVHWRRGVTTHGFSLNANMDMQPWQWLSPCGLSVPSVSLAELLGRPVDMDLLTSRVSSLFAEQFNLQVFPLPEPELLLSDLYLSEVVYAEA